MHADSPHRDLHRDLHHRYFRAKEGHWRGKVGFEITGPQALRASPLRSLDKWSMRSMALASRRLSTLVLSTTVDYASRGHQNEVLHTTRMSSLGVTLFRSREAILLGDDGLSFRVRGAQAFFPRLWKATEWFAYGAVAADHDGAVYQIPLFGVTMEQRTRMTPQGLEVTQMSPFSRASILLVWQRALRGESSAAPDSAGT